MKKMLLGLSLTTILSATILVGLSKNNNYQKADAISAETEISVGPGFFYDMDPNAGQFGDANSVFWDTYSFNSMGTFFRGESAEGWTGTLVSRTWTQYTQYVYFTWSAQNNSDNVYLKFYYEGCGDNPIILKNTAFVENPMMLWYAKIPDEAFRAFNGNGFEMHVELVDNATADYGFNNFGYLHANQTVEQVSDAMRYYINHLRAPIDDWEITKQRDILNHYFHNGYLKEVFYRAVDNIDEDFESNSDFLNHWYKDTNYDNYLANNRHVDNLIGTDSYRNGSNMPFNKTGEGYFKGWYEGGINQGYIDSDEPIYRFVSRPFVLKGNGLVSIKMAGRAASLHVIDAETREDLAWADLRSYSDDGDENNQALSGFNTVTMVKHFINLEAYVGKTIQLALADVYSENWAASYFDDLKTCYESYPALNYEVVKQENETLTSYAVYRDRYIASTHIENDPNGLKYKLGTDVYPNVDETPIYEEYIFLNKYFSSVRNPNNQFDYKNLDNQTIIDLIVSYQSLSNDAKSRVDDAHDYYYEEYSEEWYKEQPLTNAAVKTTMEAIESEYDVYAISFDANEGTGTMDNVYVMDSYTLPECAFTAPENTHFAGWLVGEDLKQPGEEISVSADVVVKASWENDEPVIVDYTITFDSNGGTGDMSPVTANENSEYPLPECEFNAPEGKEFEGWLVGEELKEVGSVITINQDLVIKASWKEIEPIINTYTVSFDSNSGSGTMENVTVNEGEEYTLPACTFEAPEDKEFDAWLVGEENKNPGDKITVNSDLVIKATWKDLPLVVVTHTVTFNPNGGTGTMDPATVNEGEEYRLPACTFTAPEGKEFDGWLVGQNKKQAGDVIIINSDVEVSATWKTVTPVVVSYTITFNPNGGTGYMKPVTVNENDEYTLPECTFIAPEGKEFDSWSVNGKKANMGDKITVTGNVEVRATWKDIPAPVEPAKTGGCGGSIEFTSIVLSTISLVGISLILFKNLNNKKQ